VGLPSGYLNIEPGRDDDVRSEQKQEQDTQFKLAQLTNQREADLTP
jgi:hypothetical protein